MVPATVKRTVVMPTLMSRRVLNEHKGRGPSGPRLTDLYISGILGQGWLVQNFSGAMVLLPDPGLDNPPFPEPVVTEEEVRSSDEIQALVADELAELDS